MSERYNIDFEVGNFSEWDNTPATTTKLFVTSSDPISGGESASAGWKAPPSEEASNDLNALAALDLNVWRIGMKIRNDSVSLGTTQLFVNFFILEGAFASFQLVGSGTDIIINLDTSGADIAGNTLENGTTYTIEMRLVRASALGVFDGEAFLYQNGLEVGHATGLNNFAAFDGAEGNASNFELFSLRIVDGAGHSGSIMVDDIIFRDDDTQIYPPAGSAVGGLEGQPIDIDADGTFLYIASLDENSEPILVRFAAALNANGTIVYQPAAGTDIGVQCGDLDADVIYVAGFFGGTDMIAKSEDGGTTFIIIDPATFGDITSFIIGPNNDDRLFVADSNGAYQETEDGGDNWIERNAATPGDAIAFARLDTNHEEMVLGGEGEVHYSVNSGHDTEDITLTLPDADVPSVVIG